MHEASRLGENRFQNELKPPFYLFIFLMQFLSYRIAHFLYLFL